LDRVCRVPIATLARLTPGRNLGWPFCNPDPDVQPGVPDSPLDLSDVPFTIDVQTNPNGSRLDCASLPPVDIASHTTLRLDPRD
jgi:hypothetical protein